MKKFKIFTCIFLALLVCATIGVVSAEDPFSGYSITGKVFVSSATFDPAVFFTGDKGTVTYVVTNSNTNTSVKLNHVSFSDEKICSVEKISSREKRVVIDQKIQGTVPP